MLQAHLVVAPSEAPSRKRLSIMLSACCAWAGVIRGAASSEMEASSAFVNDVATISPSASELCAALAASTRCRKHSDATLAPLGWGLYAMACIWARAACIDAAVALGVESACANSSARRVVCRWMSECRLRSACSLAHDPIQVRNVLPARGAHQVVSHKPLRSVPKQIYFIRDQTRSRR